MGERGWALLCLNFFQHFSLKTTSTLRADSSQNQPSLPYKPDFLTASHWSRRRGRDTPGLAGEGETEARVASSSPPAPGSASGTGWEHTALVAKSWGWRWDY